jgi:hypothetical protein
VQVSNGCPSSVNSGAATVTVTPCTPAGIGTQPQSASISSGNSTTLSVVATGSGPFTYQWYIGASGNTSNPVPGATGASVHVSPLATTSYWVQESNNCPSSVNSAAATVTVTGCTPVQIVAQPQSSSVLTGGTAQLSVGAFGSSPITITWYKGTPPDQSTVIGTGPSVTTPPITTPTQFYAIVKNCGGVGTLTNVVTISVTDNCEQPAITSVTANPTSAAPGTTITLSVAATGTSLTYQWYKGNSGDTSNPIAGGTAATITDVLTQTTSYWVRVTSGCGKPPADSQTVPVTVTTEPCVAPSILQPPDIDVLVGATTTLHITTTAGTEPFQYQWYQGVKFDTRFPFGTTATITTPPLTQDTPFFVNIKNECGNVNTETITVRVKLKRRETVIHR